MKTKKVRLEFEYTNPSILKMQLDYIYERLIEGCHQEEIFRHFAGHKTPINIYQEYKKLRTFRLVTDEAIYIKSNI